MATDTCGAVLKGIISIFQALPPPLSLLWNHKTLRSYIALSVTVSSETSFLIHLDR